MNVIHPNTPRFKKINPKKKRLSRRTPVTQLKATVVIVRRRKHPSKGTLVIQLKATAVIVRRKKIQ